MNSRTRRIVAALRGAVIGTAVGGLAALVGGWIGSLAEERAAGWFAAPVRSVAPARGEAAVAFVVGADAGAEIRGLAAGIAGFRDEVRRAGYAPRLALVVAGDGEPHAATFGGAEFTGDGEEFRAFLERLAADAAPPRPRLAPAIDAAAELLRTADGRRGLVVVAREPGGDDLAATAERLRAAGVSAVSLAVPDPTDPAVQRLHGAFPGALLRLGADDPSRRHFELAVPALAGGLVNAPPSWWPSPATVSAAAPAAAFWACVACLTAIGLLAARRFTGGGATTAMRWGLAPLVAAGGGGLLGAAGVVLQPTVPHANAWAAALLGGGIAWLATGAGRRPGAWLARLLAAGATAGAAALLVLAVPTPPWPATAAAFGAPLGAVVAAAATAATPSLRLRLAGGRTVPLRVGLTLAETDLPGLVPAVARGPVAEVVANPKRPGVLGLRNLSKQPWTLLLPSGGTVTVPPGRPFELAPGIRATCGRSRFVVL